MPQRSDHYLDVSFVLGWKFEPDYAMEDLVSQNDIKSWLGYPESFKSLRNFNGIGVRR